MPDGRLDVRALKSRFEAHDSFVLLDVREPSERECAAIACSDEAVDLAIPMGTIPSRVEELATLDHDFDIVVYCHHGVRSDMVAKWLRARGLSRLFNLEGGIDAWSTDVDPSTPRY